MNATGTNAKPTVQRVRRMVGRPRATTAAVALSTLALCTAVLAPPASAGAGALAGTWTSVDVDGSHQTMRIKGAGKPTYAMFLRDDFTTGVCGGPPAKVVGRGVVHGSELVMRATLICLPGGNPFPGERITVGFEYHARTDTLTDYAGVVWERVG